MPPPPAKPVAPRKRNRKRKRRAASESSSESSSSDSESEVEAQPTIAKKVVTKPAAQEESPSESSSESSSDSDSEPEQRYHVAPSATLKQPIATKPIHTRRKSPSPSPPPSKIPSFLPTLESAGQDVVEQEKVMKERFRTFWMSSVADGFKSDLEEIRKEPNLGPSRLSLLIDSLASGADIFASSSRRDKSAINEVEVILE